MGRHSDHRGGDAGRPRGRPARGLRGTLLRVKEESAQDNLSIVAAGVAFYALLAIFPGLAALVSVYGLVADPAAIHDQISGLQVVLPGEVYGFFARRFQELAGEPGGALGIGVATGLLLALWSTGKGMKALIIAFNIAYDEREERGFFRRNALVLLLTVGAILFILVTLGLIAVLPALLGYLGLPQRVEAVLQWGRWPLLAFLVMLGLAMLYRYAPDRTNPRWRWVTWGSAVATVLWLAGSALFSLYVSHFGSYNKTYGSLATVVILLMWFYLTAYAILLGAEFDSEIERRETEGTSRGRREAKGERSARAA